MTIWGEGKRVKLLILTFSHFLFFFLFTGKFWLNNVNVNDMQWRHRLSTLTYTTSQTPTSPATPPPQQPQLNGTPLIINNQIRPTLNFQQQQQTERIISNRTNNRCISTDSSMSDGGVESGGGGGCGIGEGAVNISRIESETKNNHKIRQINMSSNSCDEDDEDERRDQRREQQQSQQQQNIQEQLSVNVAQQIGQQQHQQHSRLEVKKDRYLLNNNQSDMDQYNERDEKLSRLKSKGES